MQKIKILLIDDDLELCDEITDALCAEGYLVECTASPERGRELIDTYSYDIAILDYKLRSTTGVELLRYLKKKRPETKVFIASGRPFIEKLIREENVAHLVCGILHKPFDCEELLIKLKQ